jgi:putative oxidoreductase
MENDGILHRSVEFLLRLTYRLRWLAPLLMRLFLGYFFLETGWGKIHNLDGFTQRFAQWGIPHPAFNAALSAYTEFIGGVLTIAGLFTRAVSIAMIINMAVAVLAVKIKQVSGLDDFVELDEPLYALGYFWLMMSGAGAVSLDYLLERFLQLRGWSESKAGKSERL